MSDSKRNSTGKFMRMLDAMDSTRSPIAQTAVLKGNAAGVHGKNPNKQARIQNRREEQMASRGDFSFAREH